MMMDAKYRENINLYKGLLCLLIALSDLYLIQYYDDLRKNSVFSPVFSGMSDKAYAGCIESISVVLMVFLIIIGLKSYRGDTKDGEDHLDYSFLIGAAAYLLNIILIVRVASEFEETGLPLVYSVIGYLIGGSFMLLQLHNGSHKIYKLLLVLAFALAFGIVVSTPIGIACWALRLSYDFDISLYFVNPPVVAGVFVLPHYMISAIRVPNDKRAFAKVIVYGGFISTMSIVVPWVIVNVEWFDAFKGNKEPFKACFVMLYSSLVMACLEALRPKQWPANTVSILKLSLRYLLFLLPASTCFGLILYSVALLGGPVKNSEFIIIGQTLVGAGIGVMLPICYAAYEKMGLSKLTN